MPHRNILGIFGTETVRLLREKWPNASVLAEELFAIFTGTTPINIPPGSTLQPSDNPLTPRLTVPNYTAGQPIMNIPGHGALSVQAGSLTFTTPSGQQSSGQQQKQQQQQGSTFPGKIVSGSGSSYTVAAYLTGLTNAPTNVTATQLQIDPAATIPTDSWVLLGRSSNGAYFMQFPTWG